jgi:hypothetical protein
MIISHFELLFKNQAPSSTTTGVQPDVAVQGYFLEITNLDTKPIQFLAEFVIAPPGVANRNLANNALCFIDEPPVPGSGVAGTDNRRGVLEATSVDGVFIPRFEMGLRNRFTLPAGGTGLLAVLPQIFQSTLDDTPLARADFEVRGFVRLRVPAVRRGISIPVSQSNAPVPVLLTPQNRTSFVRNNVIEDQTQASLPLATGVAQVMIDAEPGLFLPVTDFVIDRNRLPRLLESLPIEPAERAEMLAGLLAEFGTDKEAITALNKAMAAAEIGVAIERRKVPA